MTNESMSKFSAVDLPSPKALASQLAKYKTDADVTGTVCLLMKEKLGGWAFGTDGTAVAEGSVFVVNPYTFVKGWICFWNKGGAPDEVMVSEMDDMPARPEQPDKEQSKDGYIEQRGVVLTCVSSPQPVDIGMQLSYKVTTRGGLNMLKRLAANIGSHATQVPDELFPTITLAVDKKQHRIKSYGELWYPNYKITGWLTADDLKKMAGSESAEAEEATDVVAEVVEAVVEESARPRRRRPVEDSNPF